jgi:MoxR-like ATPase
MMVSACQNGTSGAPRSEESSDALAAGSGTTLAHHFRAMEAGTTLLSQDIERETLTLKRIEGELRKVIVGQDYLLDRLLVGLLARGHLLIEGVPGLAKTLAVKTLAQTLAIQFQRIQFTPDLLPADLIGTLIYDQRSGEFQPRTGPVFTNLLLADEINRAPAKVQSALLEAMEERQVTLGDRSYPLEQPFLVLATQNPIEQEGTYPLAEAQVDRFLMKLKVGYPSRAEELEILDRMLVEREVQVAQVADRERILALRKVCDEVYLDGKLRNYILDITAATRAPRASGLPEMADWIAFGASPRATLFLARAAKAMALVRGRGYVIPEDVKETAPDVLRHRIVPTYEAEAEEITSDQLIQKILDHVPVP